MRNILVIVFAFLTIMFSCDQKDVAPDRDSPFIGLWVAGLESYKYDSILFTQEDVIFYSDEVASLISEYEWDQSSIIYTSVGKRSRYQFNQGGLMIDMPDDNRGWMIFYLEE